MFRAGQAFRGVFLGADKVTAAFAQNDALVLGLVVKKVGGDQRVDPLGLRIGQEGAAFGDFAVLLLAESHGHGDGASVLVTTRCDDHTAFAVADALAIQSKAAGQQSRMGLQEGGESVCIGRGVDSSQQVVERVVAGHGEPSSVLVAHAESKGLPLALGQTSHFELCSERPLAFMPSISSSALTAC